MFFGLWEVAGHTRSSVPSRTRAGPERRLATGFGAWCRGRAKTTAARVRRGRRSCDTAVRLAVGPCISALALAVKAANRLPLAVMYLHSVALVHTATGVWLPALERVYASSWPARTQNSKAAPSNAVMNHEIVADNAGRQCFARHRYTQLVSDGVSGLVSASPEKC